MNCSQCRWHEMRGEFEKDDVCKNPLAERKVGGIRDEARITFYTCAAMLEFNCANHRLFQAAGCVSAESDVKVSPELENALQTLLETSKRIMEG